MCIHQIFEDRVKKTPNNIAVSFNETNLTYQELNCRANQIAHYLNKLGVKPETLVGLHVERSLEMVISLLGILKAGGAYLPLDVSYPQERLSLILEDARPQVLLTQQQWSKHLPQQYNSQIICLDTDWEDISQYSQENPNIPIELDNLAYIIYTSGSTGRPKGVLIEHSALLDHSVSIAKHYALQTTDKVLQFASISFDVATEEIFPALLNGATVVLRPGLLPPTITEFQELIECSKLTVLNLPASYWHEWVSVLEKLQTQLPSTLRLVIVGNEKVLPNKLMTWQKIVGNHVRWLNAYGLTETTITSTIYEPDVWSELSALNSVPIGLPIDNTQVYLLDENKQPVRVGTTGELYIGGSTLSRGYLNQPDLTAERFISNPFSDEVTSRLFKTGDLARVLADGNIEILGRIDNQVKIRGFRIQTEEIEAIINQHPQVQESVVMLHEDRSAEQRLIAYILPHKNTELELWPLPGDYRVYDSVMYYAMTYDYDRNKSYELAIKELVKDKVVVDIGTGKDIVWAKYCAESGAKKVYAIEMQYEAYQHATKYVEELGLTDKISIIHGDAMEVELPEKVDICVSELIGSIGNSEGAVSILNDARKFLKSDGIMIPQRCATNIAAVYLPESFASNPYFAELPSYYTQQIFSKVGHQLPLRVAFKNFPKENISSTTDIFEDINFNQPENPEYDRKIRLTITKSGKIDGFLLWLNLYTSEVEFIDSLAYIGNWLPVYFPVFFPGIEVTIGDTIELNCSAKLSEDNLNPDYYIKGYLTRKNGLCIDFEYDSLLYKTPAQSNLFYERLFSNKPKLNEKLHPVELSNKNLLAYLKEHLPNYMLPSYFLTLNSLPLTPNSKVDRKALPIPREYRQIDLTSYLAPRDNWELQLTQIWENLLGIDPIGVTDNFFDLGGNSLSAIRLMLEIELKFSQKLPLTTLFPNSTIEDLARIIRQKKGSSSNSPLVSIQPKGTKPPFFCVHPTGGNVLCYQNLAHLLGEDQPFYGLQSAGIDNETEVKTRIEDMAHDYLQAIREIQPHGPYFLGGWSFGGVVAFEMAQQLHQEQQEVALLALIDSWAPHQNTLSMSIDNAEILAWFAQDLGGYFGQEVTVSVSELQLLNKNEQLDYLLARLRAANVIPPDTEVPEIHRLLTVAFSNRQAERSYKPLIYPKQITLFRALNGSENLEQGMGWQELTDTKVKIYQIPGDHYTIVKKPDVQVLASQLKLCLLEALQSKDLHKC